MAIKVVKKDVPSTIVRVNASGQQEAKVDGQWIKLERKGNSSNGRKNRATK